MLRGNAVVAVGLGVLLLLSNWDLLYQALSLPQARPALIYQVGGALIIAFGYLLWSASSSPAVAGPAARASVVGTGLGALVLATWLVSGRLTVVPRTQILAVLVTLGLGGLTAATVLAIRRTARDSGAPAKPVPAARSGERARRLARFRRPANPFRLLARGVPVLSAEGLGLFRVALGLGLLFAVTRYANITAGSTRDYELWGSWASLDALATNGSAVSAIKAVTVIALVLFTIGLLTRAAYVVAVLGIALLVLVALESSGAHNWGLPLVTLLVMTVVRWGDGLSVDEGIRRLRGRGSPRAAERSYGLAIWLPGFLLGVALLAAAWSKIAVNGGFDWALTGAVQFHWVTDASAAPVDWALRIAQYEWLAVLFAASGMAAEALFIGHAFFRSYLIRGLFGLVGLSLLLGFMLFQGLFWLPWWLLLAALLPWQRMTEAVMALMPVQVVLVDEACSLCRRTAVVLHAVDGFNRLRFFDANDAAARERYAPGVSTETALANMHVAHIDDGTVRAGYDGYVLLARSVPVLWPLAVLGPLPGVRDAGRALYARAAAARGHGEPCSYEVCARAGAGASTGRTRLPRARRSRPVPSLRLGLTTSAVLAVVLAAQIYASAVRIEREPFLTNFPMYSGTYASRAAFAQEQRESLADPRFETLRGEDWVDITPRIEELRATTELVDAAEQAEGDLLDARKEEESLDQETLKVLLEPVDEVREQYAERYSKAFGPLRVSAVSQPYLWDRGKFGPRQSVPLMTFTEDDVAMADREPRGLLAGSRTSG